MKLKCVAVVLACIGLMPTLRPGEAGSKAVIVNRDGAKWVHEARDPAGAESVTLREDANTGGLELLVTYPAGHVFPPHWHDANERIVMLSGRLSIGQPGHVMQLDSGGFAFLPARETQSLSCVSKEKCIFYVAWDGSPRSHPVTK